jgi:hypothetical protein
VRRLVPGLVPAIVPGIVIVGLLLGLAAPAQAAPAQTYAPVVVVHQERLDVGPYELTVGFSEWPVRAQQSLDFTFEPAGGIEQVTGTLVAVSPSGAVDNLRRPVGWTGCPGTRGSPRCGGSTCSRSTKRVTGRSRSASTAPRAPRPRR